jgi:hypothetical protein
MDRLQAARDGTHARVKQDVIRQERTARTMNKQAALAIALGMVFLPAPAAFAQTGPGSLASPWQIRKTVAIGTDDTGPGRVYLYVGRTRRQGDPVERAGLHGGCLHAIAIAGTPTELRTLPVASGTSFSLTDIADPAATHFLRPRDGAWDTQDPDRFYFVTTDRYDQVKDRVGSQIGRTRLWRLNFDSIENPEAGGTVDLLLDGTEAGQMYEKIAVDADGNVLLQEDAGGVGRIGKIWKYDPATDALTLLAKPDPDRFGDLDLAAVPGFIADEERSVCNPGETGLKRSSFIFYPELEALVRPRASSAWPATDRQRPHPSDPRGLNAGIGEGRAMLSGTEHGAGE